MTYNANRQRERERERGTSTIYQNGLLFVPFIALFLYLYRGCRTSVVALQQPYIDQSIDRSSFFFLI